MGVQLTQEMINGAITAQEKHGVPASVTLGQILLESGGTNPGGLSGLAYNHNNLFGMKAGSSWTGKTVTMKTTEYNSAGQRYTTNATFRSYNSVAESIDDHGKLLASPIYTNKTNGTTNLNDYVQAMGSVYATSPTYASTLMSVINSNNLTQYDNKTLTNSTPQSTVSDGTQYSLLNIGSSGGDGKVTLELFSPEIFNHAFSKVAKVTVIILLVIMAFSFFLKAFSVSPKKVVKKVGAKAVKAKTGVDIEPAMDIVEGVKNE